MSPREPSAGRQSLLALGSAAVIAVYAAGYERTRTAAAAFTEERTVRRPVAPTPNLVVVLDTQAPVPRAEPSKPVVARGARKTAAKKPEAGTAPLVSANPAPAAPAPTQPPPPDTSRAAAQVVDSVKARADSGRVGYKDGNYYGWGRSRHGDIEAAVEIKDGRITFAYINQCLTQYSCSWISMLPGQVVARQSAECDSVSGATQSANAFYYAVVQALAKAK